MVGVAAQGAPRRGVRATAAALLLLLAGAAAATGEEGALPAQVPPGARFATQRLGFPSGRIDLPAGRIDLPGARLAWPQARLAEPKAASREELRFELAADVLFDFDRAELRPEAEAVLADLLAQVRARLPKAPFLVEGHTDSRGSDEYNQRLSERRAEAVCGWLLRRGKLAAGAVEARGFGERRPVAPNERPDGSDDPAGRQRNRRVEITARAAR